MEALVRPHLTKKELSCLEEVLQHPLFDNDLIPFSVPHFLQQVITHTRRVIAMNSFSHINSFWNASCGNWKEFNMIGTRWTATSIMTINIYIASIPWSLNNEFVDLTKGD
jgi:hypothetical protein